MKPGALVWVHLDKDRPAIVIEVKDDELLVVVHGTSTSRPGWRSLLISHRERCAFGFGLTGPTHFHVANLRPVHRSAVYAVKGMCPPAKHAELMRLIEEEALEHQTDGEE